MLLVEFFKRIEDGWCSLSVFICQIQEIDSFADGCVLDDDHVFGENFKQGKKASLGVEPGVCIELNNEIITFFWMGYKDLMILPTPKS